MGKLTVRQFEKGLADYAADFRAQIEAGVDGLDPSLAARQARKDKAESDFGFFARTYFPHYIRPHADGRPVEPSAFQRWIIDRLPELVRQDDSVSQVIVAPRGEAKTTYLVIFVLWCMVFRLKRFIFYISDTYDQAAVLIEAIKAELEVNPRIAMDFPDAAGAGRVWKEGEIVTKGDVKLKARGSGQRVRGFKHGPWRPDLIIGDDLENDENVKKPEQRDKQESWLDKGVANLGEAGAKCDVILVGTVLHYDAVIMRQKAKPMWDSKVFQAIVKWPDNMAIWDQWAGMLKVDGPAAARAFHAEWRSEMERGAVVSWPDKRPLLLLMELREKVGHSAFDSEYQNDPLNADDAPFAAIQFWTDRSGDWLYFGALDPSLGKNNRGNDPSAILVGAFDRERGRMDVIEAGIRRRLPDTIIADVIEMQRRHRCLAWFVETVQFQEFLRTELMRRAIREGVPLSAVAVQPTTDKVLRILGLQIPVKDGLIRLHPHQQTLMSQLRHFPMADHDDGPDALEMLWTGAVGFVRGAGGIRTGGERDTAGRDPGRAMAGVPGEGFRTVRY
ncbi:MAG: phage terminase large subunit [Magnetospirillum sp. WYHS-4]